MRAKCADCGQPKIYKICGCYKDKLQPSVGLKFVHKYQVHKRPGVPLEQWPNMKCTVVSVDESNIWYRNKTGHCARIAPKYFPYIVRSLTV